jgi:hypothetical protein
LAIATPLSIAAWRGDEFHRGSLGIDPRSLPPKERKTRDIYRPALHIHAIKVMTRDFR